MNCTEELLKTIEEDAFLAMTPSEIARHTGLPADELKEELRKTDSRIAESYRTGQIKAVKLAKEQIKEQAKIGNPTALEQYIHNITDMIDDE